MKNKSAARFSSRVIVGCIVAILLGDYLDTKFGTTPWIMLGLLLYVIAGSFYLLIKENQDETSER